MPLHDFIHPPGNKNFIFWDYYLPGPDGGYWYSARRNAGTYPPARSGFSGFINFYLINPFIIRGRQLTSELTFRLQQN